MSTRAHLNEFHSPAPVDEWGYTVGVDEWVGRAWVGHRDSMGKVWVGHGEGAGRVTARAWGRCGGHGEGGSLLTRPDPVFDAQPLPEFVADCRHTTQARNSAAGARH